MRRLIALLLAAYPRALRDRFEVELRAFLEQDLERRSASGGAFRRTRFVARSVGDLMAVRWRGWLARRLPGEFIATDRSTANRGTIAMDWPRELRWALRGFRRQPGFHALAVLTLAVGIGATVAAFSVLDAVVLRPLPHPSSDRLVLVGTELTFEPGVGPVSEATAAAFVERSRTLDAFAVVQPETRVLRGGDPESVLSARVSQGFLAMLGARAAAGRLFTDDDHAPGATPVVLLAWSAWRSRYGGNTAIVGTTVTLDSVTYEVAGVLSPGVVVPEALAAGAVPDYWTPLALNAGSRGAFFARGLGRLRRGASPASAARELTRLQEEVYGGRLPVFVRGATAVDLRDATLGDIDRILWMILGAVGLLLAIACTNVSNLMLARATDRRSEVAVRLALGATSARLARQFVAEGLVIALAGGIAGAALAHGFVEAFVASSPSGVPRIAEVGLDLRGLGVALITAGGVGIAFGLLPGLELGGSPRRPGSGHGSRASLGRTGARLRRGLVIAETAMALLLVLTASLLARSFQKLASVDPGFDVARLLSASIELGRGHRNAQRARSFHEALVDRLRASPGIRSGAITDALPFAVAPLSDSYTPEGASIAADESIYLASATVSDDFFSTLGLRLREGRTFGERDHAGSEPVIVVNDALADAHWPDERHVVGRRIKSGSLTTADEGWFRIVGVVSNARYDLPVDPAPMIYRPMSQHPSSDVIVIARFDGTESAAIAALRAAVGSLDPDLPIRSISTLRGLASASIARQRFYTLLGAGFGALALVLALVGTYGVATYAVMRRTHEIGIRIALGGQHRSVARMLVAESLRLTLAGVAIGLLLGMAGRRLLEGVLFGVAPTDLPTIGVATAAVLATAAVAAWIPARRATRCDPMSALRPDG